MNYDKAMGCEGKSRKDRRFNVLIGAIVVIFALVGVGFTGLTVVQLVRAHSWHVEATELAQRVDKFTQCGEYESYQKCVDRIVSIYTPEVTRKLLAEVREMLGRGAGGYWPANIDYVWGDDVIGPKISLQVSEETLAKGLFRHPSLRSQDDDNG